MRGNSSNVEEESQASGEMNNEKNDGTNDEAMNNAHTNNDICVGHDVKKFFHKMGWYGGKVIEINGSGGDVQYAIKFDDRDKIEESRSE